MDRPPVLGRCQAERERDVHQAQRSLDVELEDATGITRGSEFGVFASADTVRFLRVPKALSRSELADLEEFAKQWGAKGLAYLVYDGGEVRSPIVKFLSPAELEAFKSPPGTTLLFAAADWEMTSRVLGALRTHLGRQLDLIDEYDGPVDALRYHPDQHEQHHLFAATEVRISIRR